MVSTKPTKVMAGRVGSGTSMQSVQALSWLLENWCGFTSCIVDQFLYYSLDKDRLDFEQIISGASVTYPVLDSTDEIMIRNLGSSIGKYEDSTDAIFISGFFAKS